MADLFGSGTGLINIPLPGAELKFQEDFFPPATADALFQSLLNETDWKENEVFVWGRWHKQPRLLAWHGDAGTTYSYSGSSLNPSPWTPTLLDVRQRLEPTCAARFNSVLLNLYRDGNDRMGWHSDDEPELGSTPTIASISLGATRDMHFKHRQQKAHRPFKIALAHGSLLVMAGDTQRNWLHAINKQRGRIDRRINLTFRWIEPTQSRAH